MTLPFLLMTFACSHGGGGGTGDGTIDTTAHPMLAAVHYGRLVDVYGLTTDAGQVIKALFRKDVVIGGDIDDERPTGSQIGDFEITYDFDGTDPDTLQPRLFIPRDIASDEFKTAFDALDDNLREVTPMRFGEAAIGQPFSVVPRNAALRLTFSARLDVDDSFFVGRDEQGRVTELRNTEAVQLLRIDRDPEQPNAFVPLPARVIVRERELVIDPVLLGGEGLQYQTPNRASGMPASPDQFGANIRVAIALEGPLAMPGLRESPDRGITGLNNSAHRAIVRDFRTGNDADVSADIVGGFARDPLPLRIVGELPMLLERVDDVNAFTQEVTVYKNGMSHEIDRGDVLRFVVDSSGIPLGSGEVVVDPEDDRGDASVQHVRVRIRRVPGLADVDPRRLPGYPISIEEREPWLVQHAPRAVCIAEFTAGDGDTGDEPRNFLSFVPEPLRIDGYAWRPEQYVSPFAGAVVRFTKPVDMSTVKWADTFFFATRNLTTPQSIADFVANTPNNENGMGIDPAWFDEAKYRTPYLITARVYDEDGSQTALRLQPTSGFYLDEAMRTASPGTDYSFFLHLISASADGGVSDLAGNRVDLQGLTAALSNSVVVPFTVDTRVVDGQPVFEDNLAVSIVRRFGSLDEDASPSYFHPEEVRAPGSTPTAATDAVRDLFGAVLYLDGRLQARPTTRVRLVADDQNQAPMQQQTPRAQPQNALSWCPQTVWTTSASTTEDQRGSNSAGNLSAGPVQNPLNPFGCRLQTLWREVDMSLSRDDPFDFNLDIEQMYWAPFRAFPVSFDLLDHTSLVLGHSEYRPTPCVGDFSSLPSLPESGLRARFEKNFLWNQQPIGAGNINESQAPRSTAYADQQLRIDPSQGIKEPTGLNTYLPLPTFQKPYLVWRDETVREQGGNAGLGSDLTSTASGAVTMAFTPYILSPFAMGQGRRVVDQGDGVTFVRSYWNDATNRQLGNPSSVDEFTGGLLGAVACPLLADLQTLEDSSELPAGAPFFAFGSNGWQTALAVQSDPRPRFRVLSAGRSGAAPQGSLTISPSDAGWNVAVGGWGPNPNSPTAPWIVVPPVPPSFPAGPDIKGDNTFYWVMMDALKRQSVATNGFLDLLDPHRVPEGHPDVRLGPWFLQGGQSTLPAGVLPRFAYEFDPPLSELPGGTQLVPQFRGADAVDDDPWYWRRWIMTVTALWPTPTEPNPSLLPASRAALQPTAVNFPLDPFKAGDAHLRKWDTRPLPGTSQPRNWWTYLYNRHVTTYVEDPNQLFDPAFTAGFAGPDETFSPAHVRYMNWRFVMSNNVEASPPISPTIETFAISYRFERR